MTRARVLGLTVLALVLWPAPALADTYCAGRADAGCLAEPSAAAAFAAAARHPGRDTILLGPLTATGPLADAPGEPVTVIGAGTGADGTNLSGLELDEPGSWVARVAVSGEPALRLGGGRASGLAADGPISITGTVDLEDVLIAATGEPALEVGCGGDATGRHVTAVSSGSTAVSVGCGATLALTSSVAWARHGFAVDGNLRTAFSDYPEQPSWPSTSDLHADPAWFSQTDLRPRADSPLVDAGDPAPLAIDEPLDDVRGDVRVVDGNGDGIARRDIGAAEHQPPPPPSRAGNLLLDPAAEEGPAGDGGGPGPAGWIRTGGFTAVRYGTPLFPTLRAAAALGAGAAFFAGGPAGSSSATQVVDVSAAAPEIDAREATVDLAALLGGYRHDAEQGVVEAEPRGPAGGSLGVLRIGPVTAADRGNATTLVPRSASAPLPALTRTIAVTMRAVADPTSYDDAYFDSLALVPHVPAPPVPMRPHGPLRAYAGVVMLSPRAGVDRKGRAWVLLGCPSRTVGRCSGVVTLVLRHRTAGWKRFGLRPGRTGRVGVPLDRIARRALRSSPRLRGVLYAASRDAQNVTRTKTAPIRVERRRRRR